MPKIGKKLKNKEAPAPVEVLVDSSKQPAPLSESEAWYVKGQSLLVLTQQIQTRVGEVETTPLKLKAEAKEMADRFALVVRYAQHCRNSLLGLSETLEPVPQSQTPEGRLHYLATTARDALAALRKVDPSLAARVAAAEGGVENLAGNPAKPSQNPSPSYKAGKATTATKPTKENKVVSPRPAGTTGTRKRFDLFGFPVSAVIRWMGKVGWSAEQAIAALKREGIDCAQGTVVTYLAAGKKGQRGDPADLTKQQIEQLSK